MDQERVHEPADYDRIIDKHELRMMVPFHPSHLKRLEDAGQFPMRVPLGQSRVGWSLLEIIEWIELRKAARSRPK
jgi:prophage regulatory protein